jgi:cyclic-di-GMP phosphodiesterase, flagellum assembly factor TipF
MLRLNSTFIGICMLLIAGSISAVGYLLYGFTRIDAAVVAIAVFTVLALMNAVSTRTRDRADIGDVIADLSRAMADLGRKVAEIEHRVEVVNAAIETVGDKARAVAVPLAADIELLGTQVRQLTDSVAVHDRALLDRGAAEVPATALPAAGAKSKHISAARPGEPEPDIGNGRFKGMDRDAIIAAIRQALETNRVDLYAQPIVTLPQRKVRYYEASARLRTASGEELPADYRDHAQRGGLVPMLDNQVLLRCVQVVRRLGAKKRDIGLFCPIAGETLIDSEFFPRICKFLDANRAIASSLVLEFAQSTVRALGPLESKSLAALAEMGFCFCMDRVADLRLEPGPLAGRGFRSVKIPAALLLGGTVPAVADVRPADFSDQFGRLGIDLMAERIESEGTVLELLDCDVRFGQGSLFSPPRPVRADLCQRSDTGRPPSSKRGRPRRKSRGRDSEPGATLPKADGLPDVLTRLAGDSQANSG